MASLDGCCVLAAYLLAIDLTLVESLMGYGESVIGHLPYFMIFAFLWYAGCIDQHLFGSPIADSLIAYVITLTRAVGTALLLGLNRNQERKPFILVIPFFRFILLSSIKRVENSNGKNSRT